MRLLYLIGYPGAGKSTLLRTALEGVREQAITGRVPHIIYGSGQLAQIGAKRSAFSGTDALQMSIQPKVLAWLESEPYPNLVAEGDRLANAKFFNAVKAMGIELDIWCIDVAPDVAHERRLARGSKQDPSWVRGRMSKVENLKEQFNPQVLPGSKSVADLAAALRNHPTIASVL